MGYHGDGQSHPAAPPWPLERIWKESLCRGFGFLPIRHRRLHKHAAGCAARALRPRGTPGSAPRGPTVSVPARLCV